MITVRDIVEKLDKLAPRASACDWDNPGLLVGRYDKEVSSVYVALDATAQAVSEAIESGCDMIVTHHPIIFRGIKAINDESSLGLKLMDLIKNDVSVYSMHTNFDSCPGGMADIVCKTLELKKLSTMEPSGYTPKDDENGGGCGYMLPTPEADTDKDGEIADINEYGIGFVAKLQNTMSCEELAGLFKEKFSLPSVSFYDSGAPIRTIACCPGSGRGELKEVMKLHVDAFISGDMGHHEGLDLKEEGISLIDAGHYGLEHIFIHHIGDYLAKAFPGIEIMKDETGFPARYI